LTKQKVKSVADVGKFYQMLEDIRTLRYVVAVMQRSDRFYGAKTLEGDMLPFTGLKVFSSVIFSAGE